MNRVKEAANIINISSVKSLLDIGCRGGSLRDNLWSGQDYFGCDLIAGNNVDYLGDFQSMVFDRKFDCVVALDMLEHVD